MIKPRSIRQVHDKLARAYGPVPRLRRERPLDSLIGTILSQNTSDVNSDRSFRSLRRAFPSWELVEQARPADIARAIRVGGLSRVKSVVIRNVLRTLREREGRLTLCRLGSLTDDEAIEYLVSLPGVGIKTAACVLLFSLGRPVFPVDTHVFRTTRRLGWLDQGVRIEDATRRLQPLIPPRLRLPLHLYLVWHGRRTCRARNPRCPECPVVRYCKAVRTGRA